MFTARRFTRLLLTTAIALALFWGAGNHRASAATACDPTASDTVFGPKSGRMPLSETGFATADAKVCFNDMIISATFHNPYAASKTNWDYGFLFRDQGDNNQYRLALASSGDWELIWGADKKTVASGNTTSVDTGTDATNFLYLIVTGDNAYFFVNGDFVSTLDVSEHTDPGAASLAAGMYNGDFVKGAATGYDDYSVYQATMAFGPKSGHLKHVADNPNLVYDEAKVKLLDFLATITFTNPYDTSKGAWDYGLLFRDTGDTNQFRVILSSDSTYTGKYALVKTGIASGDLKTFDTSEGATNTLTVLAVDKTAYIIVNGEYVDKVDLTDHADKDKDAGSISATTGVFNGDQIDGATTDYANFMIWSF